MDQLPVICLESRDFPHWIDIAECSIGFPRECVFKVNAVGKAEFDCGHLNLSNIG